MRFGKFAIVAAALMLCQNAWAQDAAVEPTPGWELRSPATGGPPCRAVKVGASADTQLLRNRENHLVLIAAHGDWPQNSSAARGSLMIDDAPAISVVGFKVQQTFIVLMSDEELARLRDARALRWMLPWGEFTADVTGLGAAFDAIAICPG